MIAHRYQVWSWGGQRKNNSPYAEQFDVGITVVAKRDTYCIYEVFNELVCMTLGRAVGLPIPIGLLIERGGHHYYCSGNVGPSANAFPPANMATLARRLPSLYCGIGVFDGWILNGDRHRKNIFYDATDDTVFLFDHGLALLHTCGIDHMVQLENELSLHSDYFRMVSQMNHFCDWYERIVRIPESFIRDACIEASRVGVSREEAIATAEALAKRRTRLPRLFRETTLFPGCERSLFSPYGMCSDDPIEYVI